MRSSSFVPYLPNRSASGSSGQSAKGVADLLQSHDKLRSLMPTVTRLAALQRACEAALPVLFSSCIVLQIDSDNLLIAVPNAAVAAKLKQQLPKLQDILQRQGWQVNAIRLKVQVGKISEKSTASKKLTLPNQAVSALATLEATLEPSARNAALKAALQAMLTRHRGSK